MRLGLVLVGALLLCEAAAGAPRPGKVVRVERGNRFRGTPRYCTMSPPYLQGACYGKRPEVGEHITLVDTHRVIGTLRVEVAEAMGSCSAAMMWSVRGRVESGDLQTSGETTVAGFIDVALETRATRLVTLEHDPGDRRIDAAQMIGVDFDGHGTTELATVQFMCDDHGEPPTATSPPSSICVEIWAQNGRFLERVRTDRVPQMCN